VATPRLLTQLSARPASGEVPDPTGQGRRRTGNTGQVELTGACDWMKNEPLARAILSPADARKLAIDLMVAAERAEGRHVIR
jgi:hypothetical protein